MEDIKAFLEKAKTDAELMAKLSGLGADAGADGIISLAGEYGFTLTKEEVENAMVGAAAPGNELSEEQLAAVAGGAPTQNRYNPAECKKGGRTMYNCVGFLQACWCDHYRKTFLDCLQRGSEGIIVYLHECAMGCFKYAADAYGDIVPEYNAT